MNELLLKIFTDAVLPLIIMGISAIGGYGLTLINKKIKSQLIKSAMDQLASVAKNVVNNLNQTIVAEIKDKSADGKLSPEDIINIKNRAITLIKSQIQDDVIALLTKNNVDIDSLINTLIESIIYESKK